jgi:DNA-binding transcriptional regulator YdaS (Cro superfamily)
MSVDKGNVLSLANCMALEHDSDTALARAVRAAGSQSAFGRLIGKRQSVINGWLDRGDLLPVEFVETVEKATGVSRHDLRPDLAHLFAASPSTLAGGDLTGWKMAR